MDNFSTEISFMVNCDLGAMRSASGGISSNCLGISAQSEPHFITATRSIGPLPKHHKDFFVVFLKESTTYSGRVPNITPHIVITTFNNSVLDIDASCDENPGPPVPKRMPNPLLSKKNIETRERLIFALDVPSVEEGKRLVESLGDSVMFYKLGLQFFMIGAYYEFIAWLGERGKKVFVDLKFFDVPETVRLAVEQLQDRGATFATVHGNEKMLRAAASVSRTGKLKILAVTLLTSVDEDDMEDLGFKCSVQQLVLSRARRALEAGADGVISSGLEAEELRNTLGENFLIVSPGIRPVENRLINDDQKRVVDVEEAFLKGADYIVVGRPIRDSQDPRATAESYQKRISDLFD